MKLQSYALLILTVLTSCGDKKQNSTSTGEVIQVAKNDKEMEAAMQAARESFPAMWKEVEEERKQANSRFTSAMVKAYFPSAHDPDSGEHLWIDQVTYIGDKISGVITSEPLDLVEPKLGDRISIPLERLSDWLVVDSGIAKGAYSVQLLRKRMSAAERDEHDSHYPFGFSDPKN